MVDSMVNLTSRALRSDADDGRYRERDRRELCGVTQIESGDNETTTAHRESGSCTGRTGTAGRSVSSTGRQLLTSAEIGRLGGFPCWAFRSSPKDEVASHEARTSVRPLTG